MRTNYFNRAYSLIELAIVLVVIGLLTASIYSAMSLVHSAKVRSVMSESKLYQQAINAFESKYSWLPGDFPLASQVWPSCDATPTHCNGNGDGIIENNSASTSQNEALRAWQQMALAEMIKGSYSGTATSTSVQYTIGTNIPSAHYTDGGWAITSNTANYSPPTKMGQVMTFAAFNNQTSNNILSTADAYSIDKKLDDGFPNNGLIFGMPVSATNGCVASNTSITEPYNLSETGISCILLFVFKTGTSS